MTKRRVERVNSLLKEVISETIQRDLKNIPVPQLITITAVDVSGDLRHAKVFISIIENDPKKKKAAIDLLNTHSGIIAVLSSKKVVLRYFPELTFKLDESIDNYMQIDALLRKIEPEKTSSDS